MKTIKKKARRILSPSKTVKKSDGTPTPQEGRKAAGTPKKGIEERIAELFAKDGTKTMSAILITIGTLTIALYLRHEPILFSILWICVIMTAFLMVNRNKDDGNDKGGSFN